MKKIMILGASILQLPAILKAKDMGLEVIAVDINKNAIGFNYADVSLEISTNDIPRVIEFARQYKIDGIMTLASDMPMQTVAAVCKELNLFGISEDTAFKATNKSSMRTCLNDHNIPIPKFFTVDNYDSFIYATSKIQGKLIVKPADNSGSRGVFYLKDKNNKELVEYAFTNSIKFSRSLEVIVEEFMEGPEVSVETLSIKGEVFIIAITDKLTTGPPSFVEIGHSQPSTLSLEIQEQIVDITRQAINAIGIDNGPAHTEIIITKEGPKVVEIGARLGGDNITSFLVPLSTGFDMVKATINIAIGKKPIILLNESRGSAIRYLIGCEGALQSIEGVDSAKKISGVKKISILKQTDEQIRVPRSSNDRIGYVISTGKSPEEAIQICENAMKFITIKI